MIQKHTLYCIKQYNVCFLFYFSVINFLNNIEKGDIVITQDYGLASLVLSRNSYAINQSGMVYTNENIDELLYSRYISKKMRNSGARIKGPKKRDKSQDIIFKENLEKLILNII